MRFPEGLKELPDSLKRLVGRGRRKRTGIPPKINYKEYFQKQKTGQKSNLEIVPRNYVELHPKTIEKLRKLLAEAGINLVEWGSDIDHRLGQLLAEIQNGDCSLQELQSGKKPLIRFTYRLEVRMPGSEILTENIKAGLSEEILTQSAIDIVLINFPGGRENLNNDWIKLIAYGAGKRYVKDNYPGLESQWYFYMFDFNQI